ncbi:hypothetical protein HYC85_004640 [Camellia sinensis]|uniref:Uncharacterized protein n=1 Tax=Camellia sinensis TaxID=4442 RepID=A0A7J7HY56_CAMSI|nr:hypothetical protein HYC85_004640 [Camellia sinensis]
MDIAEALHHIQELAHSVNHRAHCFQPFNTTKECMEAEPNLDNFTIDYTASNAAIFRCGVFLLMALGKTKSMQQGWMAWVCLNSEQVGQGSGLH